jgi:uncharacterized membrane protein
MAPTDKTEDAPGKGAPLKPQTARALASLTPDQAAQMLEMVEKQLKRSRIQFAGYIVAAVVLLVGSILGLVYMGRVADGTFVGWVFLVPLGLCGIIFVAFGKWSERYRTALDDRLERKPGQKPGA